MPSWYKYLSNNLSTPFKIEVHVTKYKHFCRQESVVKPASKDWREAWYSSLKRDYPTPVPSVNDSDPWYKAVNAQAQVSKQTYIMINAGPAGLFPDFEP